MRFKDNLKFLLAKITRKKTILFSRKDGWEGSIRNHIKDYVPFFYELDEINPGAFDAVVPLTLYAQKFLNANTNSLVEIKAIIPSNYCIELCDDKEQFNEFLGNNGFGQLAPTINQHFSFPYILKRKTGEWGEGISIIFNSEDEMAYANEIESDDYFKQEYIEGNEEYTAHVIVIDKNIIFLKTLKFIFNDKYYIKGKQSKHTSVEEVDHSHFKRVFEAILGIMNYQGICCFNYKLIENDIIMFEMNPRFGSSLTRFINEAIASYRNAINNS